ncbi:competence type IV pilus major pilin ComGC [Streptococcus caprae]|uniref:Competence type IV pilus major pilin ComGC n=1 Tax=Streptococcus caprae TaxID=1640501 RepID=A0ABV8CWY0_9STRE
MKSILKQLQTKTLQAFTLLEMLMVLVIISVLMLLFVPNLSKQKENVEKTGGAAIVKVVESQAELFEMAEDKEPSLADLQSKGYITEAQVKKYNDYYAKNSDKARSLN